MTLPDLRQIRSDIIACLASDKGSRFVVGFAAETEDVLEHAREKLVRKHADLIVANDVSRADSTFGADTSRISFVAPSGVEELETLPLADVADAILNRVCRVMEEAE